MEAKQDSSAPGVVVDNGSVEAENGSAFKSPSPKYRDDNFFDFQTGPDTDIWGPSFTRTLRKTRSVLYLVL